jgi:hypothetical protein
MLDKLNEENIKITWKCWWFCLNLSNAIFSSCTQTICPVSAKGAFWDRGVQWDWTWGNCCRGRLKLSEFQCPFVSLHSSLLISARFSTRFLVFSISAPIHKSKFTSRCTLCSYWLDLSFDSWSTLLIWALSFYDSSAFDERFLVWISLAFFSFWHSDFDFSSSKLSRLFYFFSCLFSSVVY